jgi:hypothetical protein
MVWSLDREAFLMRAHKVLNMVHGANLTHGAPPIVVSAINAIMEKCRRQLVEDLARPHSEYLPDAESWGAGTRSGIYGFAASATRIKGETCYLPEKL